MATAFHVTAFQAPLRGQSRGFGSGDVRLCAAEPKTVWPPWRYFLSPRSLQRKACQPAGSDGKPSGTVPVVFKHKRHNAGELKRATGSTKCIVWLHSAENIMNEVHRCPAILHLLAEHMFSRRRKKGGGGLGMAVVDNLRKKMRACEFRRGSRLGFFRVGALSGSTGSLILLSHCQVGAPDCGQCRQRLKFSGLDTLASGTSSTVQVSWTL